MYLKGLTVTGKRRNEYMGLKPPHSMALIIPAIVSQPGMGTPPT